MIDEEFHRLQGLLETVTDPDEFIAVCSQLRHYAGLPPRGHKLSYDFFVAQRSVKLYNETWHRG